tara:strand:- start:2884 stop:3573 length:690 start_codon:yes stop_codon:yes gene_type:complete
MTQQLINLGTAANNGTGDNLRSAMDKTNDNFTELYGANSVSSNLAFSGQTISSYNTNGDIIFGPDGTGKIRIANDLIPDVDNTRYIGNANVRPLAIYVGTGGLNISANAVITTNGQIFINGNVDVVGLIDCDSFNTSGDAEVVGNISCGNLSTPGLLSVGTTIDTLAGNITATGGSVTGTVSMIMPTYANDTARDTTITSPIAGMTIFKTDIAKLQFYDGAQWRTLTST